MRSKLLGKCRIAKSISAKDIQRASYRKIDITAAQTLEGIDISHIVNPTGISDGQTRPLTEKLNQRGFNALAFALNIHGMD